MRLRILCVLALGALLFSAACRNKPSGDKATTTENTNQQSAQQAPPTTPPAPQATEPEPANPNPPPANPNPPPANPNPPATSARNAAPAMPTMQPAPVPPPKPAPPKPIVIPAGTVLTVRTGQAIGSKTNQTGDTFPASLAEPVMVAGKTVIPPSSATLGVVTEAVSGGKIKGESRLSVRLSKITIRGTSYSIDTSPVDLTQKGKGKRSATMIGGGAGAGALIGGLAGGGKGAAIGALAGGGAGTAGAAMTGNKELTIPAESALSFKLAQPLTIRPQSSEMPPPVTSER